MATNLEALPIGDGAPQVVNAVIEVPVGSRNKYEFEPSLSTIVRDRVLPGSVRYPVEYGFIPSTEAPDGEPVDILVAGYDASFPGCVVQARIIGLLDMRDASGEDPNVFAVPADDPRFDDIAEVDDLPDQNLREIEQFFEAFKKLEGDHEVEIRGWLDAEDAYDLVREAMVD
jgi:inorganic pyrophosphatase